MSLRLVLLAVIAFGLVVAYLTSLNPAGVSVSFGSGWTYELPVVALAVGALLVGVSLALALGAVRDLTRSYRNFKRARRERREESSGEIYRRGLEAQLAGQTAAAAQTYAMLLRREPAHVDAALRLGEIARARGDGRGALEHDMRALRSEERPEVLLAVAADHRLLGEPQESIATYRRALGRGWDHAALSGVRDVAAEHGRWAEAIAAQEQLVRGASRAERAAEETGLAGLYLEHGRALLAGGDTAGAIGRFRKALRARPDLVPAALALGDALLKTGDAREAARVWERALDTHAAAPLLARLAQIHRAGGRPARMVALYEDAARRHPDDLAVAFGLARVYLELAMLDEAAEQIEKIEVRAPEMARIHAFLAVVFERRGQARQAFEEYRRALGWSEDIEWPHRCSACGAAHAGWVDRCPSCRLWNTSRP